MIEPTTLRGEPPRRPANMLAFGLGAALLLLLYAVGSAIGGELGQVMAASLNPLPFAVLAILAYLGAGRPNWAWVATALWLLLLVGGAALLAILMSVITLADGATGSAGAQRLSQADWLRLGLVALGCVASTIAGAVLLLPPARQLLARVIPIDPGSFVHAVAVCAVVAVGLICSVPLVVLGTPPLLAMVGLISEASSDRGATGQLLDMVYGLVWTVPAAVLAVGFGISRDLRGALERLGLVRPTLRQAGAAVLIALLLVGAVQLIGLATGWLAGALGWPITDEGAFGELMGFAINPIGAVVVGVVAGLGEELGVRGVLQPRLGLLISNLFFTSLHAMQYHWDALLIVFVVGMACGLVRKRTNTSTAAIVHGVYNFTLVLLAALGAGM